jgi:PPOX class probable F420-dependent enzyme
MTPAQIMDFLRSPVRAAVLATTRPDGRPHATPIWFEIDGDELVFNTGATSVKGRNLAADPRLTICVQDDQPPFSFAVVEGRAELIDDLDQAREWAARIGGRYMGADRAEEYGKRNGVPGELVVRVRIERMTGAADVSD